MIPRNWSYAWVVHTAIRPIVSRMVTTPLLAGLLVSGCLLWLIQNEPRLLQAQAMMAQLYPQAGATESLYLAPGWFLPEFNDTRTVAWGDVDNDGDLDLAVGNYNEPLKLYENNYGVVQEAPIWRSVAHDKTFNLAWGDMNGDGYLDLAVANGKEGDVEIADQPSKVYLNQGGTLSDEPVWQSAEIENIRSVAWGDVNGDGLLDLALGDHSKFVRVYINQGNLLPPSSTWTLTVNTSVQSIALGDADNDGDLDLAVGTNQADKVYFNESGLQADRYWEDNSKEKTRSIAWGDMNGDGFLDLAVGNEAAPARVYQNNGNRTFITTTWASFDNTVTTSVAWGDADGDGDLDLAVGNSHPPSQPGQPIRIYRNEKGLLQSKAAWTSDDDDNTRAVAWGDMDGDGDLDLAAGKLGMSTIYLNRNSTLSTSVGWTAPLTSPTTSVAWGDVDGDGDLDLAVGSGRIPGGPGQPDYLYENKNGTFAVTPLWASNSYSFTRSVAWGDVDGDGDLDLAIGNSGIPFDTGEVNELYLNNSATLEKAPAWRSQEQDETYSVAWGDMDSDGDLDLAVGNRGMPNRVYRNDNGMLEQAASWVSTESERTLSVAWGDVDNDGDLDLAAGNSRAPIQVYLNQQGQLQTTPGWNSADISDAHSVAWGDMNGDGFLDLAVGNDGPPSKVYVNQGGQLQQLASWNAADSFNARSVIWGDVDGDGDLDLAIGNDHQPNKLYLNERGMLQSMAAWSAAVGTSTRSLAWGDIDGDGDLDLAVGNTINDALPTPIPNQIYFNQRPAYLGASRHADHPPGVAIHLTADPVATFNRQNTTALAPANFYATAAIRQRGVISLTYTLFHPTSEPVGRIRVYYSPDGNFSTPHAQWRVAKAMTGTVVTDLATAPYPTQAGNTHHFVWAVADSDFLGQSDNVVVRIEALPTFKPRPNSASGPFQRPFVASQTFPLRMRGTQVRVLTQNSQPAPASFVYQLRSNQPFGGPWIGTQSEPFLADTQGYLSGRSELGLGDELIALWPVVMQEKYTLYHTSAKPATDTNPTANGLVTYRVQQRGVQTLTVAAGQPLFLFNLTVSLQWDASNDPGFLSQLVQDLGKASSALYDWTNGQVALGQVTVYQAKEQWDTADIRIYASNQVRPVANRGGIVQQETILPLPAPHAPITATRGAIRIGAVWNRYGNVNPTGDDWPNGLAHELGHYLLFLEDTYLGVDENSGLLIPIDSCTGTAMTDPYEAANSEFRYDSAAWVHDCAETLAELPEWELMQLAYPALQKPVERHSGPPFMPFAFTKITIKAAPATRQLPLLDTNIAINGSDPALANGRAYLRSPNGRITDLGRPVLGILQTRGAYEGDELCIFGFAHTACTVLTNGAPPQLQLMNAWRPEIVLTPTTTTSLELLVNSPTNGQLTATIYPGGQNPQEVTFLPGVKQLVALAHPANEVWIDLTGDQVGQRVITEYSVGAGPGRLRWHAGPVTTGDGRVTLYPPVNLAQGAFLALQTAATLPSLPAGLLPLGRSYYVRSSQNITDLRGGSIAFQYLEMDVLLSKVPEQYLAIYHWNGMEWQKLHTELNQTQNFASAPLVEPGLYALLSAFRISLHSPAWNLLAYPLQETLPITQAVQSLEGAYSVIYSYELVDSNSPWQVYGPDAPTWVNDLQEMKPGQGYWIYATQPITWMISPEPMAAAAESLPPLPPMTVYGIVTATTTINPVAGMSIKAYISGNLCGEGSTKNVNGQTVYVIKVLAASDTIAAGCGQVGQQITFAIADQTIATVIPWDNARAMHIDLDLTGAVDYEMNKRLYLPVVQRN